MFVTECEITDFCAVSIDSEVSAFKLAVEQRSSPVKSCDTFLEHMTAALEIQEDSIYGERVSFPRLQVGSGGCPTLHKSFGEGIRMYRRF